MTVEPGSLVARRYRVRQLLGRGGMGEVWAAQNVRTGRMVALKLLRAEAKTRASSIERFRREAKAAGVIRSQHVTEVLDVEDDPEHGIVLVFELLEGESLVDRLKRTGPIDLAELWGIVEAVWIGLCDAHAAGIIHRDLKPSNVFLELRPDGALGGVKILDFGISKLPKDVSMHSLTQAGQSLGTFSFMPPEQIGKAKTVDHRADIYACSTLIYQALSGQLPYLAKNVVVMMELKNKQEPRRLSEAMADPIDSRLDAFVARGLARDPAHRFQTAAEALAEWRALRPMGSLSAMELCASGSYPRVAPPAVVPEVADSTSEGTTQRVRPEQEAPRLPPVTERVPGAPSVRLSASDIPTVPGKVPGGGQLAAAPPLASPPAAPPALRLPSSPGAAAAGPGLAGYAAAGPIAPAPLSPLAGPRPEDLWGERPTRPFASMQPFPAADRSPAQGAAQADRSSGERLRGSAEAPRVLVPAPSSRRPPSRLRTTVTLVLGALVLMLVGFVLVAVLLHFFG